MNAIDVRPAGPADAPALLALRRRLFAETDYMLFEAAEFRATEDDERKLIERLRGSANSNLFVATDGYDIAGFLAAIGGERKRQRHSALLALGVARAFWSRGIASRLLDAVIRWADTCSLVRLELTVHTTNLRATALYLRHGFEVEGRRRCSLLVDGEYVDEYLMSRVADV